MNTSDCRVLDNKGYIYRFIIFDNFSNKTWCVPLMIKNVQTITDDTSKSLTKSKRSRIKIQSDRGKDFYKSIFQKIEKYINITTHDSLTNSFYC